MHAVPDRQTEREILFFDWHKEKARIAVLGDHGGNARRIHRAGAKAIIGTVLPDAPHTHDLSYAAFVFSEHKAEHYTHTQWGPDRRGPLVLFANRKEWKSARSRLVIRLTCKDIT